MAHEPKSRSFPVFRLVAAPRKSRLEQMLSPLADVRAGEGAGVLLLAFNVFVLLGTYYILKTVRESLILTEGGAEVKAYSSAGQAILLLFLVPAYGALAARVSRIRLISWVTLFFVSHLLIFYLFGMRNFHAGVPFFLWVGIFNVFVIAQFWAFANDLYTEPQGKRLFPIVGLGSSIGAWVGAEASTGLVKQFGPYPLMLAAAVLLVVFVFLMRLRHRRESSSVDRERRAEAEMPVGKEGAFALIFHDRYLLLIAVLIVLLNLVNSTGEFLLSKLVVSESVRVAGESIAARQRFVGAFYGQYFSWVNLLGLLLQMFLVSRIFHYIGVRGALFILPAIAFGGYSTLLAYPVLRVVRGIKILENSVDYSIQNTARQALFLPTSRTAKYKAKTAIDTFFMRAGDVLQGALVYVGTVLAFTSSMFAAVNVFLTLLWLVTVAAIFREHKRRTAPEAVPAG